MPEIIIGGFYKHFKGTEVQVIAEGTDTTTKESVVIYRHYDKDLKRYETYVRRRDEFLSPVDKNKYPNAEQDKRFVYTGTHETITLGY